MLLKACNPRTIQPTLHPVPLGREIRRRRKALGLTLEQLAERSGLSSTFLSRVETSDKDLALSTLKAIAKGLGTQPTELLGPVRGLSPAASEIGRLYDAAPTDIQEGVALILRASARRRR